MWYMCGLCGPIMVRSGQPFNSCHCIEHVGSASYKKNVALYEHLKKKAATASKDRKVSDKDLLELKATSRSQVVLVTNLSILF